MQDKDENINNQFPESEAALQTAALEAVLVEKGFIDEVINPHNTRKRVIGAFSTLKNKKLLNPHKKHDNIPL